MPHVDIPHLDLPFHYHTHQGIVTVATVEQDSMSDIANCVETIMLTPIGWRDEAPTFGSPNLAFHKLPIGVNTVEQTVAEQEPRITMLISEEPDKLDQLVDRIKIELKGREGEGS